MRKFLRGIVCYITFVVYIIGFSFYLVTSLVGEDELKIAGIILLIIGLVLSIIESRFYPKGKRARCAAFFFVNGAIIFCYMSILLIPAAKMISTMLEAQHGDFFDWKEGTLIDDPIEHFSDYTNEEESGCITTPKVRKSDLAKATKPMSCDEILEMSTDEIIDLCCKVRNDFQVHMTYIMQKMDDVTAEEYAVMMETVDVALATVIGMDAKLAGNEKLLLSKVIFKGNFNLDECMNYLNEYNGGFDTLVELTNTIESYHNYDLRCHWIMIIKCAMLVDGPLTSQEREFFEIVGY